MSKCLGCYMPIAKGGGVDEYHILCSKKLFGTVQPPMVNFDLADLEILAKKSLSEHLGITGVQPKISVDLEKYKDDPKHRLMIVGLWGNFILKPPSEKYPDVSIVEDVTMHMAGAVGIKTAVHGLIRLKSGELAYVTKRFDRSKKNKKIAVEDFCQLSELLTESKYSTSSEKAAKIILKFSSNSGLDLINFYELILFSFLTGNADMHLKNFSLMRNDLGEIVLAPAYDLLATQLMPIDDKEEVALTVNGKKAKLKKNDFIAMGRTLKIPDKAMQNSFVRLGIGIPKMLEIIDRSFLSPDLKSEYKKLIRARSLKLDLVE